MISGHTTKKRKMDRISALPDSLICHILSFLSSTKAAVSTSLLSGRWRHLWQHLQDFHFDFELEQDLDKCDQNESFMRFAAFVNGVLAHRRSRDIRNFRLLCSYTDKGSFHERSFNYWLLAAIGPQLQEFYLSLSDQDSDSDFIFSTCYSLPRGIFTCSSLVSLTLDGLICVENISSVHLPALKTLNLYIDGAVPMDKIFSGCPVLEDLFLHFNLRNAPKITVPNSLKSLSVNGCTSFAPTIPPPLQEVEVEIDAPVLEYLAFFFYIRLSRFTVNNLHNVKVAYLNLCHRDFQGENDVDYIHRLLKALTRVEKLYLRSSTTECILRAPTFDFPKFSCLLHLEPECLNPSLMINLLFKCPMLQVFKICNDGDRQISTVPTGNSSSWTPPTRVPDCLASQLTKIEFTRYEGSKDELAFVAYVLKSGLVLQTLTVDLDWLKSEKGKNKKKCNILAALCAIPRGLNMCRIEIKDSDIFPSGFE